MQKAYESLSGDDESRIKEMAFLQYEINELESAALNLEKMNRLKLITGE